MYETCACVITLFYSATCALILSVISHWCLRGVHVLREALVHLVMDTLSISYQALWDQWVVVQELLPLGHGQLSRKFGRGEL